MTIGNENRLTLIKKPCAHLIRAGYAWNEYGFWYRVASIETLGVPVRRYGWEVGYAAFAAYDYEGDGEMPVGLGVTAQGAVADLIAELRACGALRKAETIATLPPRSAATEDPDEYVQWQGDYARSRADEQAWEIVQNIVTAKAGY